ncbi:unnamed protein product [Nezara viridula]|uniref:Angio-associated migratory cell protein n=1 Tax=Nezara viridula TaxID=85310 RepID=A0A9P0E8C0_NEZVI|nr:unnamed protein product [Nezara viridula]
MTYGDRPIESNSRSLVMDDEFEGLEEYEIIDTDDLEVEIEMSSTSEEEEEAVGYESDSEFERKMSCIPTTDHASFIFSKHTGSVYCIGIHPQDENIVITGGQDEKPYIWNSQTGEVLMESDKFSDSVLNVAFNHDGKYVAAIDMGGKIQVWKTLPTGFNDVWDTKIDDVQWMRWHPQANVLLVGESSGSVYMWKIPSGECKVLPGHRDLADVGAFMPDGKRAVICYIDGSIRVFNLANGNVCMKYDSPDIQLETVISLDVHPDNNLVAVGTISSRLYVLKTQGAKSAQQFMCVEEHEKGSEAVTTSIEYVAFSRKLPYNVIVAATDNALHVYDYVKSEERGYIPIEEGVTRLVWPEGKHTVYVGTKVGKIAVCDIRALRRIGTLEGHSKSILDLATTKDAKTLFTTSDDHTVRLFPVDELMPQFGNSTE